MSSRTSKKQRDGGKVEHVKMQPPPDDVDPPEVTKTKIEKLIESIRAAEGQVVIVTGAGISTAANVPDYRGANGLYTKDASQFDSAYDIRTVVPTESHMIIKELLHSSFVSHLISQNCDGLHLRSGIPQDRMSEIHGNLYIEHCQYCVAHYVRPFEVSFESNFRRHQTKRKCTSCRAKLQDTIVHAGEKTNAVWPQNWNEAADALEKAKLMIIMGTSGVVLRNYEQMWPAQAEKVLINLQPSMIDDRVGMKIKSTCDEVMSAIRDALGLETRKYCFDCDMVLNQRSKADSRRLMSNFTYCQCHVTPPKNKLVLDSKNANPGCPGWLKNGLKRMQKMYNNEEDGSEDESSDDEEDYTFTDAETKRMMSRDLSEFASRVNTRRSSVGLFSSDDSTQKGSVSPKSIPEEEEEKASCSSTSRKSSCERTTSDPPSQKLEICDTITLESHEGSSDSTSEVKVEIKKHETIQINGSKASIGNVSISLNVPLISARSETSQEASCTEFPPVKQREQNSQTRLQQNSVANREHEGDVEISHRVTPVLPVDHSVARNEEIRSLSFASYIERLNPPPRTAPIYRHSPDLHELNNFFAQQNVYTLTLEANRRAREVYRIHQEEEQKIRLREQYNANRARAEENERARAEENDRSRRNGDEDFVYNPPRKRIDFHQRRIKYRKYLQAKKREAENARGNQTQPYEEGAPRQMNILPWEVCGRDKFDDYEPVPKYQRLFYTLVRENGSKPDPKPTQLSFSSTLTTLGHAESQSKNNVRPRFRSRENLQQMEDGTMISDRFAPYRYIFDPEPDETVEDKLMRENAASIYNRQLSELPVIGNGEDLSYYLTNADRSLHEVIKSILVKGKTVTIFNKYGVGQCEGSPIIPIHELIHLKALARQQKVKNCAFVGVSNEKTYVARLPNSTIGYSENMFDLPVPEQTTHDQTEFTTYLAPVSTASSGNINEVNLPEPPITGLSGRDRLQNFPLENFRRQEDQLGAFMHFNNINMPNQIAPLHNVEDVEDQHPYRNVGAEEVVEHFEADPEDVVEYVEANPEDVVGHVEARPEEVVQRVEANEVVEQIDPVAEAQINDSISAVLNGARMEQNFFGTHVARLSNRENEQVLIMPEHSTSSTKNLGKKRKFTRVNKAGSLRLEDFPALAIKDRPAEVQDNFESVMRLAYEPLQHTISMTQQQRDIFRERFIERFGRTTGPLNFADIHNMMRNYIFDLNRQRS